MKSYHRYSGIPPEAQGLGGNEVSGIAIERKRQGGNVVTTEVFDNFKLAKTLVYKKLARRISELYTDERIIRLKDPESGGFKFVEINKQVPAEDPSGQVPSAPLRFKVLNDISTLKYDIVMTETPSSPTHRQGALTTLLELIQKVPAAAEILMDVIVELTDGIPNREKVLARFRALMDARSKPKESPPPAVHVSLKGEDLSEEDKARLGHRAANQPDTKTTENPMGAEHGNAQNPSGQLPVGGAKLNERPDLSPPLTE